ncbi:hypothetical protein M8A51_18460 [Schlegelella sp. S2-27]|uniref:Uncharacterized protein n=2 Tax=Caldimonas mangrovi TaxID=2944811 RepID=A0ABT0YT79_9BURK|nr:hypothetical protein [Caldimonas mangrovi]
MAAATPLIATIVDTMINPSSPVQAASEHGLAGSVGAHLLWCDLLRQVGWEMEDNLEAAMRTLSDAALHGRLRSTAISEVRRSLEKARQIGVRSQQIARIAERGTRGRTERMKLDDLVQEVLDGCAEALRANRLSVVRLLPAVEVSADRALVVSLLQGLMAWAVDHAEQRLELHLERGASASEAHLVCAFQHRAEGARCSRFGGPAAWGANWHLLRHAAHALGWGMRSGDDGGMTWVRFGFACIDVRESPAIEVVELRAGKTHDGRDAGPDSRVLVVATCVAARRTIYESIEHLGVQVEFSDAALEQIVPRLSAAPAAVILERDAPRELVDHLRRVCAASGTALIQIAAEEHAVEIGEPGGSPMARIGMQVLGSALPIALLLALSPASTPAEDHPVRAPAPLRRVPACMHM